MSTSSVEAYDCVLLFSSISPCLHRQCLFHLILVISHALSLFFMMADPLSIAASVAGLVTLTAQVSISIITYSKAVKDETKSVQEITQELSLMRSVLEQLENLLKGQPMKKSSFDQSSVLATAIFTCRDNIQTISMKLPKSTQNGMSRAMEKFKWPFTEKETQKRLEVLRRCTSTFQFSLTVEGW